MPAWNAADIDWLEIIHMRYEGIRKIEVIEALWNYCEEELIPSDEKLKYSKVPNLTMWENERATWSWYKDEGGKHEDIDYCMWQCIV